MVYRIGVTESNLEHYAQGLLQPDTGVWACITSWLGLGARVHLEKAILWLAQKPHDIVAQKAFYDAFKARVDAQQGGREGSELPIAADVAAVVSTILKKHKIEQKPIMANVAQWYMRDRVNSPRMQTLSMLQVPNALQDDVNVWTRACAGYFSRNKFMYLLKEVVRQEFEQNGFMSTVVQEEQAIESASDPSVRSTQVAERIRAKHIGLSSERKQLAKLDGAFIASSSQFNEQVKQLEKCVESKSKYAIEYFQDNVISLFSMLTQDVEELIAAGQELSGVNLSSLKFVRGRLEKGLHILQAQPLTIAQVRNAVEDIQIVFSWLDNSLDGKQGIFVEADRPYWFSCVCTGERRKVQKDMAALKKQVGVISKYLQVANVAEDALEKKRKAREEADVKIKGLKQRVDEGEQFFRLPGAKQERLIQKGYDDELAKRRAGVSAITAYLHIPSTAEQVIEVGQSVTKKLIGLAAVALITAAVYQRVPKVKEVVHQALSSLPESVSNWIKQIAKPALNAESFISEWVLPSSDKNITVGSDKNGVLSLGNHS